MSEEPTTIAELPERRESLLRGVGRTATRILPRIGPVLRSLEPTHRFDSVADLAPAFLEREGIRGVLWDIDGTLMAHHAEVVHPAVAPAFDRLLAMSQIRHAVVSNCDEARYRALGRILPQIPIVIGYETRGGEILRIRRGGTERLVDREGREIEALDPSWPLLRKPSGRLVLGAIRELEGPGPGEVLMVGDQYATDIASANLAGVRSLKVRTLEPASFPVANRMAQRLEGVVYRLVHGR